MPPLTPAALRKQIASGETDPLYVITGQDDAERAALAAEFVEMIDEDLRPFNVERLYGGEAHAIRSLLDAAVTLPMMSPRRVVVVFEAEKLFAAKRESKAALDEQKRLEAFLKAPPGHATVVLVCGSFDERFTVVKDLRKNAHVVDSGTITDDHGAQQWVKARAARDTLPLDAGAVRALVERAGHDVTALRAGLDRLSLYALGEAAITAEDVRQAVPLSPEQQDNFGIANAIRNNDAATALHELRLALDAGTRPEVILGQLRVAGEQLPTGRVRTGIEAVFRADTSLKSSSADAGMMLERLVLELCGTRRRA